MGSGDGFAQLALMWGKLSFWLVLARCFPALCFHELYKVGSPLAMGHYYYKIKQRYKQSTFAVLRQIWLSGTVHLNLSPRISGMVNSLQEFTLDVR